MLVKRNKCAQSFVVFKYLIPNCSNDPDGDKTVGKKAKMHLRQITASF